MKTSAQQCHELNDMSLCLPSFRSELWTQPHQWATVSMVADCMSLDTGPVLLLLTSIPLTRACWLHTKGECWSFPGDASFPESSKRGSHSFPGFVQRLRLASILLTFSLFDTDWSFCCLASHLLDFLLQISPTYSIAAMSTVLVACFTCKRGRWTRQIKLGAVFRPLWVINYKKKTPPYKTNHIMTMNCFSSIYIMLHLDKVQKNTQLWG